MSEHKWFKNISRGALAAVALIASLAYGQHTGPAMAGLTPKQLTDGTAQLVGHYNPSQKLRLVIGLEHPSQAAEDAFIESLYTKGSPDFHKFLTAAEWNARFAPSAAAEQAVVDWAQAQGLTVTHRYANRLLVDLEGSSEAIETALGVTINAYKVGGRTAFSNTRDPVLPASLQGIVHSIGGLNSIQVLRPASKGMVEPQFADYSAGPASAAAGRGAANAAGKPPFMHKGAAKSTGPNPNITGGAYDPTDIYSSQAYDEQALYNQGHCCNPLNNSGVTPPDSSVAIATAGTQSGSDFAGFQASYPYLAYHYQQYYIDGTPSCCDGEGTLDFDWSTAWSNSFGSFQNTAMIYMYDGVNNSFSTFTDVYNQILSDQHAKVFSTSWGCEEQSCTPTSVMDTDHGIFASMTAQGMTLVAATGDQGATAGCGDAIAVQYPASDPYIIGAGGTELQLDSNGNYLSETGWSGGPDGCGSNDGGSTGGVSSYYAVPGYQSEIGLSGNRRVPDLALNADWYHTPQNYYFGGVLSGNGGTSIVAPSIAGFWANVNANMDFISTQTGDGLCGKRACSPIGWGNQYIYYFYANPGYAPHYPFYDITSGCNNNDVTAFYNLGYYCAGSGYDLVTGLGSFNAFQLARAIGAYQAGDFGAPVATFSSSATTGVWYNTDRYVQWTIADTNNSCCEPTGVAGYTDTWDSYISDATSEATPGSGDAFYSGPQNRNATYGFEYVSAAGQGCHTAAVRSWDNTGFTNYQTYGPICYDTVPPVTTATLSGTLVSGQYNSQVTVTLGATDASSGVAAVYYKIGTGTAHSYVGYGGPFNIDNAGTHTVTYYAVDVAGNAETPVSTSFKIRPVYSVALSAALNFPNTVKGRTSKTKSITLTNTGTETVTFSSVALGGAHPSSFVIASNTCSSVKPGKTCKVGVAFKPTNVGTFKATVQFSDNASGSPQSVALSGTGIT